MQDPFLIVAAMVELVSLVFVSYLAIAFMAVGLAMMVGGRQSAGAVGAFFFVRPVQVMFEAVLTAFLWLLAKTWGAIRWMLTHTWQLARDFLLWPVARGSVAILRLAAVGFADTLHFLFTGRGR